MHTEMETVAWGIAVGPLRVACSKCRLHHRDCGTHCPCTPELKGCSPATSLSETCPSLEMGCFLREIFLVT
jgi:hypothetical protein